MTHREILKAFTGLLLALLVALLSSTIVSNALPTILADLHGSQSEYTWVVTATLLTSTATTPIWGKLSDLFSKKLLYQIAIVVFTVGSALGGIAQSMPELIAYRALQGIGLGGLQALIQVVIAAMIAPRDRGRYTGYTGAVFAVATVSGPLIGGLIVDSPLGWRWCFWVCVPLAVVAFIVLGRTLKLPVLKRKVRIDWLGATLLVGGVALLLIWVSLAGGSFGWVSWSSAAYVGGAIVALALAVLVESRVAEPVVPLRLFRNRTFTLSVLASLAVGTAMFGGSVFLGQYYQIARGFSPTHSRPDDAADGAGAGRRFDRCGAGHFPDRAHQAVHGRGRDFAAGRAVPALDGGPRDEPDADGRLPRAGRPRAGLPDAEPGFGSPKHGRDEGHRLVVLGRHLLPIARRRGGRLRARCGARRPGGDEHRELAVAHGYSQWWCGFRRWRHVRHLVAPMRRCSRWCAGPSATRPARCSS